MDLPVARWFHGSAVVEGSLFVFGGDTEEGSVFVPTLRRLELETEEWGALVPAENPVRYALLFRESSSDPGVFPIHSEGRSPDIHLVVAHYPGSDSIAGQVYWYGKAGGLTYSPVSGAWSFLAGSAPRFNRLRRMEGPTPGWSRDGQRAVDDGHGKVYVLGGIAQRLGCCSSITRRGFDSEDSNGLRVTAAAELFDVDLERWMPIAPMRQPRQLFAAAFGRNGKLYVFGGYAGEGGVLVEEGIEGERKLRLAHARALRVLDSAEVYDPATDSWEPLPPLPEPRHQHGAALGADGRLYVVGGADSYSAPASTRAVFVFDPEAGTWHAGPPLRTPRYGHSVAAARDGRIFVTGGIHTAGGPWTSGRLASVEVLDTRPLVGRELPRLEAPSVERRLEEAVVRLRSESASVEERREASREIARTLPASRSPWIPELLPELEDPDAEIRADLAEALGRTVEGDGPAARALARHLDDPVFRVRWAAVRSLVRAELVLEPVLEMLIESLRSDDRADRVRAVELFGRVGSAALRRLAEELRGGHPYPDYLVEALGAVGTPAEEALVEAAAHSDPLVRSFAMVELGRLPTSEEILEAIDSGTRDEESGVRIQAFLALARHGERAIPYFLKALEAAEAAVRATALWGLGEVGGGHPEAEAAVRQRLLDPEDLPLLMPPEPWAACEVAKRWGDAIDHDCEVNVPPGRELGRPPERSGR